jgi:hypothetical protein
MTEAQRPALRVVHGDPSADEIAVVTAVLSAIGSEPELPPAPRGGWADPRHRLGPAVRPSPGGWRASAR